MKINKKDLQVADDTYNFVLIAFEFLAFEKKVLLHVPYDKSVKFNDIIRHKKSIRSRKLLF